MYSKVKIDKILKEFFEAEDRILEMSKNCISAEYKKIKIITSTKKEK